MAILAILALLERQGTQAMLAPLAIPETPELLPRGFAKHFLAGMVAREVRLEETVGQGAPQGTQELGGQQGTQEPKVRKDQVLHQLM
jgi:hypothetical protein